MYYYLDYHYYYYYYMYIIGKALIRASNIFPSKMMHKLMTVCMQCSHTLWLNLQAQLRAAIIGMHAGVFQLGVLQINGYIHAMHE